MILQKLANALQLGGALLTLPAGIVGLYTAYQAHFSTEASCRSLRISILATLDRNLDPQAKRVLVHNDLAAFERDCALTDPQARAVYAAIDRAVLFATDPDAAASHPVRFAPPPPPLFGRGGERLQHLLERMREHSFGT